MKLKTIGHALCSLGTFLSGSGLHSQLYLPEGMPLRWIQLSNNLGLGCLFSGIGLKSVGHLVLWIASINELPTVTEATINTANLTLVTQER